MDAHRREPVPRQPTANVFGGAAGDLGAPVSDDGPGVRSRPHDHFQRVVYTVLARAGVKLIIQIPCFNEEGTLPETLAALPRSIPGIDSVEWLVVDDGSQDRTAEIARAHGVDHVVSLPRHEGLARAFLAGLEACLRSGADVIVNTDADNQYCADDIPKLVEPVLLGRADIVIGARPITEIQHFSPLKRFLQRIGSRVIRVLSNTDVYDAPSGFRAMSRTAAMQLHVFNDYTYTIESIIQAGQKGIAVASVPIRVNAPLRPSRLVRSTPYYVRRQVVTMLRIFITYRPLRFFAIQGAVLAGAGVLIGLRFVYFYMANGGAGHVQSLILAAIFIMMGFFLFVVGLLADLIAVNRQLLERLDWRVQKLEGRLNDERKGE
jgi:glycosyltransferase involved in cell wall biosynthesis